MDCVLGEIVNGEMMLSDCGIIARDEWLKTAELRGNILLDEFVVMPDHLHGIVCIPESDSDAYMNCRDALQCVSTEPIPSDDTCIPSGDKSVPVMYKNRFGQQKNNLAFIIRGYKGAVTRGIRKSGNEQFFWQLGFYYRIIRDQQELNAVRNYIRNNPLKWDLHH